MERLENMRRLFGRETGPGVADLDQRDVVGADRREPDRGRPTILRAAGDQHLGGVAAEVLDHPLDVVGVGEQLELRRDVDRVNDRPGAFGFGGLDHLTHQLAQVDAPRRRRLLASAAVSEGRLAEQDRAVERRHQPRREALGERVGDCAQTVGNELRRRQHVAQIVVDARHRHAELGKPLALPELVGERALHRRQRRLGAADLVVAAARRDDARAFLRPLAEGDDARGQPAHRPDHQRPQRRPQHAGHHGGDDQRQDEEVARNAPHRLDQRRFVERHVDRRAVALRPPDHPHQRSGLGEQRAEGRLAGHRHRRDRRFRPSRRPRRLGLLRVGDQPPPVGQGDDDRLGVDGVEDLVGESRAAPAPRRSRRTTSSPYGRPSIGRAASSRDRRSGARRRRGPSPAARSRSSAAAAGLRRRSSGARGATARRARQARRSDALDQRRRRLSGGRLVRRQQGHGRLPDRR